MGSVVSQISRWGLALVLGMDAEESEAQKGEGIWGVCAGDAEVEEAGGGNVEERR